MSRLSAEAALHEYYMSDTRRLVLTVLICVPADGLSGISKMTRAKVGQKICVSSPNLTQWKISGRKCLSFVVYYDIK